jgi:hypothetical protein
MSDKSFKVKNGLTIQGTVDTVITADNAGSILIAGDPLFSLPLQTGNSGKYLTTNGTSASWGTIDLSSIQTEIDNINDIISSQIHPLFWAGV